MRSVLLGVINLLLIEAGVWTGRGILAWSSKYPVVEKYWIAQAALVSLTHFTSVAFFVVYIC